MIFRFKTDFPWSWDGSQNGQRVRGPGKLSQADSSAALWRADWGCCERERVKTLAGMKQLIHWKNDINIYETQFFGITNWNGSRTNNFSSFFWWMIRNWYQVNWSILSPCQLFSMGKYDRHAASVNIEPSRWYLTHFNTKNTASFQHILPRIIMVYYSDYSHNRSCKKKRVSNV
jgi:hypothetical protein